MMGAEMEWISGAAIVLMLIVGGLMFPAVFIASEYERRRDEREAEEWRKQFREKYGPH